LLKLSGVVESEPEVEDLFVARYALETLPDCVGIARNELALKLVSVVSRGR